MISSHKNIQKGTLMRKNILNNIWYVLLKTWIYEKRVILIIVLQAIIGIVVPLAGATLPALVVNGISNDMCYSIILKIAIVLGLLLICNITMTYISSIYETYLLNNKMGFLSELFRKKMEVDYAYIESPEGQIKYENALMSVVNDNTGISGMISLIGPIMGNLLGLIANIFILSKFNWSIVIVLIVTAVIHLFIAAKIRLKQNALREPVSESTKKINYLFNYVTDATSIREIKIFSMQAWLQNIIDHIIQMRIGIADKSANYNFYLSLSDGFMLVIRDAFAYFVIIHAIFINQIEVWEFILYFGLIACVSSYFTELSNNIASLGQKNMEIITYREFVERECSDTGIELDKNEEIKIELKDVSFKFDEDGPYILKNINLTLCNNEKIALVGKNGAGKSTLVKIICGLYKPTKGKVLINGIDLEEIKLSNYQKLLAIAFQDTYILPMSIAENIAFREATSNVEEIKRCLKMAGLDGEFLDETKPLTKMLFPDGIVPSGGQEQKIILARVAFKLIYGNAQLLILDEPTAAMDAISEKNFYEKYISLAKNKSCILISHRLKSTSFCDSIIVMENGKIIEKGTHESLMNEDTHYKSMYQIQSSYYQ